MSAASPTPPPVTVLPTAADMNNDPRRLYVYESVKEAILALPSHFEAETRIDGVLATDIQNLNSVLGAMIEDQVVESLNKLRNVWDPNNDFAAYSFVRQTQRFPDVLLKHATTDEVILGMELKGWYLLAREGVPSFRFAATPLACAPADLFVVVPWVLTSVLSGTPKVFAPYIEHARYIAELRNWHWEFVRDTKNARGIDLSAHVGPYPNKSDTISDRPHYDGGDNFGRIARTNIMDEYKVLMYEQQIRGIKARYWVEFFKAFVDQESESFINNKLRILHNKIQKDVKGAPSDKQMAAMRILEEFEKLVSEFRELTK